MGPIERQARLDMEMKQLRAEIEREKVRIRQREARKVAIKRWFFKVFFNRSFK